MNMFMQKQLQFDETEFSNHPPLPKPILLDSFHLCFAFGIKQGFSSLPLSL